MSKLILNLRLASSLVGPNKHTQSCLNKKGRNPTLLSPFCFLETCLYPWTQHSERAPPPSLARKLLWPDLSHYHFLPLQSVLGFMTWLCWSWEGCVPGQAWRSWLCGREAGPRELGVGPSSLRTVSVWLEPSTQAPDPSAPSVSVA